MTATRSHGLGIEFTYHDPEVLARGNAGVASNGNASAVYYNPAMLGTGSGSELLMTGYALDYKVDHTGAGGHSDLKDGPAVAASAFAATPLWDGAALGFGFYSPFGQKNEWPDNSPLRGYATDTELLFLAGTAAVGFDITPCLRFGVSASVVSSSADINRGVFVPGDSYSIEGDGHGWGLGAGFTWEPAEGHRIGATGRYWSPVKYKGHSTTVLSFPAPSVAVAPAESELDFPLEATIGYAYTPNANWLFEVDVTWIGWSSFERFEVSSPGGTLVEPMQWDDSLTFMLGVTRKWDSGWWLGAGYWYAEQTTPDQTFNPRLPDIDLHVVSIGTGYRTECWAAEFTYQYGYGEPRQISGSAPTLAGASADGKLNYHAHGFSAGLRWFF
ncbi:OmpP1/FadL family transporter [Luteolibacter marinus]|uniref:OmpP1/FadL family transporter n=1 Tax=Luteolibacter marinus TaxID=2776705 RepID=UPI001D011AA1|nr:outer membrane protein transport protein [Luteolibacter marinus]